MFQNRDLASKYGVGNGTEFKIHASQRKHTGKCLGLVIWFLNLHCVKLFTDCLFPENRRRRERHGHQLYELQRRQCARAALWPIEFNALLTSALKSINESAEGRAERKDGESAKDGGCDRPVYDVEHLCMANS